MQVRINEVQSDIQVADMEALMTPEFMEKLVLAVQMRIQQTQSQQQQADDDRKLTEGASR